MCLILDILCKRWDVPMTKRERGDPVFEEEALVVKRTERSLLRLKTGRGVYYNCMSQ